MSGSFLNQEKIRSENESGGTKKRRKGSGDQYRVVINKEANEALAKMVAQVNDGFSFGAVTKSDLANWIFVQFGKAFSETNIRELRSIYFNEVKCLYALVRRARGNIEAIPEELRRAIREQLNPGESGRRRGPRVLSENVA